MSGQVVRLVKATGILCLCTCLCVVGDRMVRQGAWNSYRTAAVASSSVASDMAVPSVGFISDAEQLPLSLFGYVSGNVAPRTDVPVSFKDEVGPAPQACIRVAVTDHTLAYVLDADIESSQRIVFESLRLRGWEQAVQNDGVLHTTEAVRCHTFFKHKGPYRWMYVALYTMQDTTTCVFTLC